MTSTASSSLGDVSSAGAAVVAVGSGAPEPPLPPPTHTGTIVSELVPQPSYEGDPRNLSQLLEVPIADAVEMWPYMPGTPVVVTHDGYPKEPCRPCGKITGCRVGPNGEWKIEAAFDNTEQGRFVQGLVDGGVLTSLSLRHNRVSKRPIEVSVCFKGARSGTNDFQRLPSSGSSIVSAEAGSPSSSSTSLPVPSAPLVSVAASSSVVMASPAMDPSSQNTQKNSGYYIPTASQPDVIAVTPLKGILVTAMASGVPSSQQPVPPGAVAVSQPALAAATEVAASRVGVSRAMAQQMGIHQALELASQQGGAFDPRMQQLEQQHVNAMISHAFHGAPYGQPPPSVPQAQAGTPIGHAPQPMAVDPATVNNATTGAGQPATTGASPPASASAPATAATPPTTAAGTTPEELDPIRKLAMVRGTISNQLKEEVIRRVTELAKQNEELQEKVKAKDTDSRNTAVTAFRLLKEFIEQHGGSDIHDTATEERITKAMERDSATDLLVALKDPIVAASRAVYARGVQPLPMDPKVQTALQDWEQQNAKKRKLEASSIASSNPAHWYHGQLPSPMMPPQQPVYSAYGYPVASMTPVPLAPAASSVVPVAAGAGAAVGTPVAAGVPVDVAASYQFLQKYRQNPVQAYVENPDAWKKLHPEAVQLSDQARQKYTHEKMDSDFKFEILSTTTPSSRR